MQMQSTPSHWDMQGSVPGLQLLKTFCPAVDVRAAVIAIQGMMGLQARAENRVDCCEWAYIGIGELGLESQQGRCVSSICDLSYDGLAG